MKLLFSAILVLVLFSLQGEGYWNDVQHDRILLTSIQTLTFHEGKMTAGRRSPPVQQLVCFGANCRPEWIPSSVQCTNVGDDGFDVQWECKADLENAVRFGPVTVICEGYDSPEDPYILRGSCQLEYSLKKTSAASSSSGTTYNYEYEYNYDPKNSLLNSLFFFVLIAFLIYKFCLAPPPQQGYPPNAAPGGRGGYGPGFDGGPGGGYGGGPSCSSPPVAPGYNLLGGGPGFWGGMATGGLLGYLFRGRNYGYSNYGGGYGAAYGAPRMGSHGFSHSRPSMPSGSLGSRSASGYGGSSRR